MKYRILSVVVAFFVLSNGLLAQSVKDTASCSTKAAIKPFIVPAVLIGAGVALTSQTIKDDQLRFRAKNFNDFSNHADDLLQFASYAPVFGLDLIGVHGKHSFQDKVGIVALGGVFMMGTVYGLKSITKVARPDNLKDDSFPSGHTANAFFGATVLAKEYGNQSVWYPIAGYTFATATGALRMLNNRHWASDVLAGAGFGILSAELAYLVYPRLKSVLCKKTNQTSMMFVPQYNGKTTGIAFSMDF
jgi:membrane-associated phospholipid phosphatase